MAQALQQAYAHKPLVRLYDKGVPALKNVVGLPFCDIGFAVQGEHLIIVATEDNLLKGAAAQAVQCANIRFGYAETQSLFKGAMMNPLIIKLGGVLLDSEEALERLFSALVNYRESHQRQLVIVHGGGCVVDELMKGLNLPVKRKMACG